MTCVPNPRPPTTSTTPSGSPAHRQTRPTDSATRPIQHETRPSRHAARPARLAVAVSLLLTLSACGGSSSPTPSTAPLSPSPSPTITASALPTLTASPSPEATVEAYAPLDGLPTTATLAAREPVALTIDDSAVSRPNQAGFDEASIVYQAPAEGGEMKYMMVFQEGQTSRIGPLRSGRPHFAAWAAEYRAIFAHFGGDKHLLDWIPSLNRKLLYDISFIVDPGSKRDTSLPRPHNAFTSTNRIRSVAADKRYPATIASGLALRPFVDDLPAAQRPTSGSVHVPLPNSTIDYTYDPLANDYRRSVDGRAEIDAGNDQRVTARDVVVLFMAEHYGDPLAEPGNRRPVVDELGKGKALVFHDGHVVAGTWKKANTGALTCFYDASGQEIPLLRGRIFIQIVQTGTRVTYRAAAS
ncbi:MAG: DUF3048 domain-containing protein [Candidatus Limnocylindrales bacterium]